MIIRIIAIDCWRDFFYEFLKIVPPYGLYSSERVKLLWKLIGERVNNNIDNLKLIQYQLCMLKSKTMHKSEAILSSFSPLTNTLCNGCWKVSHFKLKQAVWTQCRRLVISPTLLYNCTYYKQIENTYNYHAPSIIPSENHAALNPDSTNIYYYYTSASQHNFCIPLEFGAMPIKQQGTFKWNFPFQRKMANWSHWATGIIIIVIC